MKHVAVLDHGMGNLHSVAKALEAAGATVDVVEQASEARTAAALCVPGQGIFGRCMDNIAGDNAAAIRGWIVDERPYLGICLGMQILFDRSEESGGCDGLGILSGTVEKLAGGPGVSVPHIGWNTVSSTPEEDPGAEYFYFDHSYAVASPPEGAVTGWCTHGTGFAARVERGPILGVQFHPEKSGRSGINLLKGWVSSL